MKKSGVMARTWVERHPYGVTAILLGSLLTIFLVSYDLGSTASGESKSKSIPVVADVENEYPSDFDGRITQLDTEAIEAAYRAQIEHLFQTWMKDDSGQPQRAITGARQARKAFIATMNAINKRKSKTAP